MSSHNLGPQGRALLSNQLSFSDANRTPVPQELDYLVNDLRSPGPDLTISKALGYLFHYIPYVKYEHNLRIIVASFLNSPVCFGNPAPSFEQNYLIIEVFKLIADKKLKISQPTLPLKEFYTVILKELTHFVAFNPFANSWKVLPIIAGLRLSDELRDELYTNNNLVEYKWFFHDYDTKIKSLFQKSVGYSLSPTLEDNVINLSLLSLAITYKKDENIYDYTGGISSVFIIRKSFELLYLNPESSTLNYAKFFVLNPAGGGTLDEVIQREILQKPVIKHANRLSFVLETFLTRLKFTEESYVLIEDLLLGLQSFNRRLNISVQESAFNDEKSSASTQTPHQEFWILLKGILFSEVIIFSGILTRFISQSGNQIIPSFFQRNVARAREGEYKQIALKILHNLYYINFILLSIGQGGFDNYNFVYYLAIEIGLTNTRSFEQLTMQLIGNYTELNLYCDVLNHNYVGRTKALFVLGLWENYLQSQFKDSNFIRKEIFDLCIHLADDTKYHDMNLIEGSHSVLLLCFSNRGDENLKECVQYIELLFSQFPRRISSNQLSIAIETIGKKVLSKPIVYDPETAGGFINSTEEFLEYLLTRASHVTSGIPIKQPTAETRTFTSAQPIPEIEANSTLRNMDEKTRKENDVVKINKGKKPKDLIRLDVLPEGKVSKDYKFENRVIPETTREAYAVSFINIVPYLPLSSFTYWLDNFWVLVEQSDPNENKFLVAMLWKILSENLDLNRSELAFKWWYMEKEIPQMRFQNLRL